MKEMLLKRTKWVAIETWKSCQKTGNEFIDYKRQLIRCSSSVGANYRAAVRAKSDLDFINKLKIVEEELDETMFFIELILNLDPKLENIWQHIHNESNELMKIIVKSITTTRAKINNNKSNNS